MSTKKELNAARAEITELRRMLARIFPSGNNKSPHALWKQIRRLSAYAQELAELADPTPARPTVTSETSNPDSDAPAVVAPGGRSAEQPLLPGVRLKDRKGDRTLYHAGTDYLAELERLTKAIEKLIDQSADWIRGLDHDQADLPTKRRPRCTSCSEILGTAWRYCPYCATER